MLVSERIALELVGFLSYRMQPPTWIGGDHLDLIISTPKPWSELLSIWQRWDSLWYQLIAERGYRPTDGSVHFQPLYPLLVHGVSLTLAPLGGAVVVAQLSVTSIAFVLAIKLLHDTALEDGTPYLSRLVVFLVVAFPTAFFLIAPYTESLYLLTTLAAFRYARRDLPWLAGSLGMMAALTRTFGILLVFPLAFEHLKNRDKQGQRVGIALLSTLLPVIGLIGLTLYQQRFVGEQESPFQLARHWGQSFNAPWDPLLSGLLHIWQTGDPIEIFNVACLLVFSALSLAGVRRLPLMYSLYVVPYLCLLYCQHLFVSPLASVCRYTLVLFPCFITVARYLVGRPWLTAGLLTISSAFQVFLFEYWVHFGFVA